MQIGKRNKNDRIYTASVVNKWLELSESMRFDIELALDESHDVSDQFIKEVLCCGQVISLYRRKSHLYAMATLYSTDGLSELFGNRLSASDFALVPKGIGFTRGRLVDDNYQLLGFNIVYKKDSPF